MKLESTLKAAIELAVLSQEGNYDREMVKFRGHFAEIAAEQLEEHLLGVGYKNVQLIEYFEDQDGNEVSLDEIARICSGSMQARMIPPGAKQHDINFILSSQEPLDVATVQLSLDETRIFGQFTRDLRELVESKFFQSGACKLTTVGGTSPDACMSAKVSTSASAAEIRSYVTSFRRLYLHEEPANFQKSATTFARRFRDNPYGQWVSEVARDVRKQLDRPYEQWPFLPKGRCTFSARRLIDAYLYTQFIHQPKDDARNKYDACLAELNGDSSFLFWMFLNCVCNLGREMKRSGDVIVGWFESYCAYHGVSHDTLPSLTDEHPGIGADETHEERRRRLLEEKSEELAQTIWTDRNCPPGGHWQFLNEARSRLRAAGA
ncbi:MAG: hypothetical protein JNK76_23370 [Planctomycetales bacterium]|nr:hypothetical protein [Planctomycetales bacterium]